MAQGKRNQIADFWKKVNFHGPEFKGTPCWLWEGTVDQSHGYGSFSLYGQNLSAHRLAYELQKGQIAEGMTLDHLCRVHHCVNPAHLEEVTNKENILRGVSFGAENARKTHCAQGHALVGENVRIFFRKGQGNKRECRACRAIYRKRPYNRLPNERTRESHRRAQRNYVARLAELRGKKETQP